MTLGLQGMGLASRHQEDRGERDRLQRGLVGPMQREKQPRNLLGVQRGRPPEGRGASDFRATPLTRKQEKGRWRPCWLRTLGLPCWSRPGAHTLLPGRTGSGWDGQGLGGTDTAVFPQLGGCQQRWLRRGFPKPHPGELRCPPADQGKANGSSVGLHPRPQDPSSLPHASHHAAVCTPTRATLQTGGTSPCFRCPAWRLPPGRPCVPMLPPGGARLGLGGASWLPGGWDALWGAPPCWLCYRSLANGQAGVEHLGPLGPSRCQSAHRRQVREDLSNCR